MHGLGSQRTWHTQSFFAQQMLAKVEVVKREQRGRFDKKLTLELLKLGWNEEASSMDAESAQLLRALRADKALTFEPDANELMEAFWEAQALDAMEEAAQQQREHEIALQLDQAKRDWAAFKKAEDLVQERKTYAQRKGEMKSRGLKATEKQASEIHTRTGHGSAVSRMMADLIAATREPLPRPARAL